MFFLILLSCYSFSVLIMLLKVALQHHGLATTTKKRKRKSEKKRKKSEKRPEKRKKKKSFGDGEFNYSLSHIILYFSFTIIGKIRALFFLE